ncbi:hypothetical protein DAI22_04g299350 [Oryza sativa Japonica Group]|nr:hypothetical protein DAI22_04g299350 [Oryza sativa Japonica Group]
MRRACSAAPSGFQKTSLRIPSPSTHEAPTGAQQKTRKLKPGSGIQDDSFDLDFSFLFLIREIPKTRVVQCSSNTCISSEGMCGPGELVIR